MERDFGLPGSPREIRSTWNLGGSSLGHDYRLGSSLDHTYASPSLVSPRTPSAIVQEGPEVARRAAEWERKIESLDQQEMEIHQTQLKLIREQTATFRGDLVALRQEVLELKGEVAKRQAAHSDLTSVIDARHKEVRDVLDRHRNDQDGFQKELHAKLLGLEREFPGHHSDIVALQNKMSEMHDVVGRHQQLHQDHASTLNRHATIAERVVYLEKVVGDSADKHQEALRALEQLHQRVGSVESSHGELKRTTAGTANDDSLKHANMEQRMGYLEKLLGDSADKHARELEVLRKQHDSHVSDAKNQGSSVQALLREEKAARESHHANVQQRLQFLEGVIGDNADKHNKAIEAAHASVQERVAYLEKSFGDSADKHARELEALKGAHLKHVSDQKSMHGSLQDVVREEKAQREQHHATVQQRLKFLESQIGESADKNNRMLEELKNASRGLGGQHATVAQRLEFVEKLLGDSADKHSQELASAHSKIDALHGRLKDFDRHGQALADLKNSHDKMSKEKMDLERHHATMRERIEYIEKVVGDSADKHSREVEEIRNAQRLSSKNHDGVASKLEQLAKSHGEVLGHHANVEERITYLERTIGDSADKHEKAMEAVRSAHGKHANDVKSLRDQVQSEKDKSDQHHADMGERILFLERAIGESADKNSREVEALKGQSAKHVEMLKSHTGKHASIEDRLDYIEKWFQGFRAK